MPSDCLARQFLLGALLVVHGEGVPARFERRPHHQVRTVQLGLVGEAEVVVVTHLDGRRPVAGARGRVAQAMRHQDSPHSVHHLRKLIL